MVVTLLACAGVAARAIAQEPPALGGGEAETVPQPEEPRPPAVGFARFEGRRVGAIVVRGLFRTQEEVARRELLLAEGGPLSVKALEESLRRLRNLRIIRSAIARVEPVVPPGTPPDAFPTGSDPSRAFDPVRVEFELEERWAIIPVVRFGGGGGSAFLVVGAYDLNVLGRYLDVGAQYENFNGVHGGSAWFRDPRYLGRRQKLSLEAGLLGRPRTIYGGDASTAVGAFVLRRRRVSLGLDREISPWLSLGGGTELSADSFSTRELASEGLEANARTGFRPPGPSRAVVAQARAALGALDTDDYLVDGALLDLRGDFSRGAFLSQRSYSRFSAQAWVFRWLPWRQNVGVRAGAGATDARSPADAFTVGGLETVRGFADGEFCGKRAWYLNAEYRVPSFHARYLVLQHVAFFDTGDAADAWSRFRIASGTTPRSAGLGLRFIVPPIARFNVRVDYAATLSRRRTRGVVFGMQQFF